MAGCWFGDQGKMGGCVGKSVHCGLVQHGIIIKCIAESSVYIQTKVDSPTICNYKMNFIGNLIHGLLESLTGKGM